MRQRQIKLKMCKKNFMFMLFSGGLAILTEGVST